MGKMSRDKGARVEREIVARHEAIGVHAGRVPLSGAAGGRFSGDVHVSAFGPGSTQFGQVTKALRELGAPPR